MGYTVLLSSPETAGTEARVSETGVCKELKQLDGVCCRWSEGQGLDGSGEQVSPTSCPQGFLKSLSLSLTPILGTDLLRAFCLRISGVLKTRAGELLPLRIRLPEADETATQQLDS